MVFDSNILLKQIMNLENIVADSQISIPIEVYRSRGVQRWLRKKIPQFATVPLVVQEERYYRDGIEVKLGFAYNTTNSFCSYGLLRPAEYLSELPQRWPVSTASLAELISWAFRVPIERILLPEGYFKQDEFLQKNPATRIAILYNAYLGAGWFEHFRRHCRRVWKKGSLTIVKGKKMNLSEISELLEYHSTNGNERGVRARLIRHGFLIPEGKKNFISKSVYNYVDMGSFVKLLSLVLEVPGHALVTAAKPNSYREELADSFIANKLIPFLVEYNINVRRAYSLADAASLLYIPRVRLYEAALNGTIKNITFNSWMTKIKGIDLAIYGIRRKSMLQNHCRFSGEGLADLLGIKYVDPEKLEIRPSPEGRYAKTKYVFPLYNQMAARARKKVFEGGKDVEPGFNLGRGKIYFSIPAQVEYCQAYGVPFFDQDCHEHLMEELQGAKRIGRNTIYTSSMLLKLKEKRVLQLVVK